MRLSRLNAIAIILLAALVSVPAWGSSTALPGTLNYVEGRASLGTQVLDSHSVGSVHLQAGQTLETQDGRVEVLLTPGIFFRLDSNSSAKMLSPSLSDTEVELVTGRATVEVAEIHKENYVSILAAGTNTQLLKTGLYSFDSDQAVLRVFDGKAIVRRSGADIEVKGGREVSLNSDDPAKARGFDKQSAQDQLYRWSKLRSSYLAEANNDAARIYTGNSWYGGGWYWDPWFGTYTFIPANGIFYSPFGWRFYSPAMIYTVPVFVGPRFHHFVGFAPRFDRGPFPHVVNGFHPAPFHPVAPRVAGPHPVPRAGGVQALHGAGGFHGATGFHGGAGFHGGGSFHGGGGFRR